MTAIRNRNGAATPLVSWLALVASLAALALILPRLWQPDSRTEADSNAPQLSQPVAGFADDRERLVAIEDRLVRLEGRLKDRLERTEVTDRDKTQPGSSSALRDLEVRLAKLEAERRVRQQEIELAEPAAIPAALAVLLAARGVITRVGDIEAIQENTATLATVVRDSRAAPASRLEAYRGILMFGQKEGPKLARVLAPELVSILTTARAAKARRSAAAFLASYMNASFAAPLESAFYVEKDPATRREIANRLIQCRGEPGGEARLRTMLAKESTPEIRQRLKAALSVSGRK